MTGIDYGMGRTNIDTETGIRFGVIHSNKLASHTWDDITANGTDLDYAEAIDNLTHELAADYIATGKTLCGRVNPTVWIDADKRDNPANGCCLICCTIADKS